ncbi:MAG: hypothetical protein ACJ8AD_20020 [Gemmatimonadaceae bacterium]
MSHNLRSPVTGSRISGDAGGSSLFRNAALPLLLVIFVALAAATLAGLQLRSVADEHLPALRDAQTLDAMAAVTGAALRGADFARADDLAQRFHAVAGSRRYSEAKRSEMRSYDASFVDYFVSARRVAEGVSMSDEADLSSAELARLAKGILKERLDTGMAADRRAVASSSVAAMKLRLAVSLLFALAASVALFLLASRRRPATVNVADGPVQMADDGRDQDHSHLKEAVARMAARRGAVAAAAAQVAERNRQQVALLQAQTSAPALTVIRGQSQVSRTPLTTRLQLGKRAAVGA